MISFLNTYIHIQILVLCVGIFAVVLRFCTQRGWVRISASQELRLYHVLAIALVLLPLASFLLPSKFEFKPIAKTYSALTYKEYDSLSKNKTPEKILVPSTRDVSFPVNDLTWIALVLLAASIAASTFGTIKELSSLLKVLNRSHLLRRIGKVRIVVADIEVPFSMKTPRAAWVVLPTGFLEETGKYKISVLHELQHHRQRDTLWQYGFIFQKAIAGFNPAFDWWMKTVSEAQELKVDEILVDQGKIQPQEYARCLISVAETVVTKRNRLACATSLAFLPERHLLLRRIESMFNKRSHTKTSMILATALILSSLTAVAAVTSKSIGSRTITLAEAQRVAESARKETDFPIAMNDLVLAELNRYVGTAQGREFMRDSLNRMKNYQPMVNDKIGAFNVPQELAAIPLVESGYQNLAPGRNKLRSAGLWQFIADSARVYDLKVDDSIDERLNEEKETVAALKYLSANKANFKNWELAILAFNWGERRVTNSMQSLNTKNAWDLIRSNDVNDQGYLAKVMAAVLIMKNPDWVE